MANWYGVARSNSFHVKDMDAFNEALMNLEIDIFLDEEGRVSLISDTEYGYWPSSYYDNDSGDFVDVDLVEIIQKHIREDDCAILMEVGNEKLRYLTGESIAITSSEVRRVDISDIYTIAESMVPATSKISLAEY